jgi:hypothetical protein
MQKGIEVVIEATPRKTFASAIDWPGWSRSGKTEELALEALAAYARRYTPIAKFAGATLPAVASVDDLRVVERRTGDASTDFGIPGTPSKADGRRTTAAQARLLGDIVAAAWTFFDRVAAAAPAELRKGPRGGGRDTAKIVGHVLESDRAYANNIGIRIGTPDADDPKAIQALRDRILEAIRDARDGKPLADRRWPARYAAHRIAWHALDHAWEIEDRTET